ncbi:orotate phosphoribosyltransferase [Vulcanisaeta souniana]|uniref:Orotate phosphoribosyltransferase n=1 Tax=Vulcanisaeta souniana JCM 11219 TaxID=1293586 RepID=A0A830DYT8_9CREN|nr:orotate phosphoribosyltransferase [Vulcanisaeta souniana]BDR91842.1 orotate phosphoribosyltransferase [Vulcanisaeta souniana JCM 11219]GGI69930.1 orotate phosphoribosyltransferase [Vulcanisaeta souniana JCM 11219]
MLDEGLILDLYGIGAIRFGRFRLTSGIESPFYIDLRLAITYPSVYKRMVKSMAEALSGLNTDIIAGIETASIPWASMIAYELNKGLVYVRKETKEHGTAKLVEGDLRQGMRVVVIDDVVTTGSSIIRAIKAIRGQGGDVIAAAVFIDREQGGLEAIRREGINVVSLARVTEVIDFLVNRGLISDDLRNSIIDYLVKMRGTTST